MKFATLVLSCLSLLPVVLSSSPEARLSNAKRLADGLTPLRPRRLFNANVARDPAPSGVTAPPAAPTAATGIRAVYADSVGQSTPSISRRQSIGSTVGYLDQFGRINKTLTASSSPFSTGAQDVAVGVIPSTFTLKQYICLTNDWLNGAQPVSLSPYTAAWVELGLCDSTDDQPAGSPPMDGAGPGQHGYYVENRVWQIDPVTGAVKFYYANTDGTVVPGQVPVIVDCSDYAAGPIRPIYVTANVPMFLQAYLPMSNSDDPDSCVAQVLDIYFETS